MSDNTVFVKYIGAQSPWFESAVTGRPSAWKIRESGYVTEAIAAQLVATGLFEVGESGPVNFRKTLTGGIKFSDSDLYRPGGECLFCLPMQQAPTSGNPVDVSGSRAQCLILPEYTDAAAWANKGYFTTGTTLGYSASMPNKYFRWEMDQDSVIVSAVVNLATPVSNVSLFGFCNTSTRYGFYVQARSGTGKVRLYPNTTGGYVANLPDSPAVFCDGTDHRLTVMIHGPSRSMFLFCDGVLTDQYIGCFVGGGTVTANLALGGTTDTGAAFTPCGVKLRGVQMYRYTGSGLPINASEIARYIHQNPYNPVPSVMVGRTDAPVWTLAIAGQSNEKGAGSFANRVGRLGCPTGDGIAPYGTVAVGSMWPRVVESAGAQNIWLAVQNTGRGSSSLVNHWCGRIVAWAASTRMSYGQYTVANGNVYRVTVATGGQTNGNTAASAPVWPASGTVVDGQLTWTYVRAATAGDTIGKIMREGDDLFDPNGWIAALATFSEKSTAEKRLVYLAFGQEDATRNSSRADYLAALQAITDYLVSRGYYVYLGHSFYGDALDTQYTSNLIPALGDALSYYSGNPLVKAGVNMRNVLGILPISPARGTLGLKADALHVTDETIAAGADLIADVILA